MSDNFSNFLKIFFGLLIGLLISDTVLIALGFDGYKLILYGADRSFEKNITSHLAVTFHMMFAAFLIVWGVVDFVSKEKSKQVIKYFLIIFSVVTFSIIGIHITTNDRIASQIRCEDGYIWTNLSVNEGENGNYIASESEWRCMEPHSYCFMYRQANHICPEQCYFFIGKAEYDEHGVTDYFPACVPESERESLEKLLNE